jgi:hypothetical protein
LALSSDACPVLLFPRDEFKEISELGERILLVECKGIGQGETADVTVIAQIHHEVGDVSLSRVCAQVSGPVLLSVTQSVLPCRVRRPENRGRRKARKAPQRGRGRGRAGGGAADTGPAVRAMRQPRRILPPLVLMRHRIFLSCVAVPPSFSRCRPFWSPWPAGNKAPPDTSPPH